MDSKEPQELDEKDMIQNNFKDNSGTWLVYIALGAAAASLLWGGGSWLMQKREIAQEAAPFLKVTNRNFSLFLWQFPEYMRANVSTKSGYLPGFQYLDKVAIEDGQAEAFVSAPPKVLFLYHTWDRLIRKEFPKRPIAANDLREFLEYAPEWSPKQWREAPKEYQELIATLDSKGSAVVDSGSIPLDVQQAYIGWKNYFLEGDLIKQVKPTYGEMAEFLAKYPHFARNYWRNIVMSGRPDYLKGMIKENYDPKALIPEGELAAFLKVAFFNDQQAKKGL